MELYHYRYKIGNNCTCKIRSSFSGKGNYFSSGILFVCEKIKILYLLQQREKRLKDFTEFSK